jgi:DNA-binding CsgD family transcriptional regulator/tetratricopeptide (TPR) repeat protein
MGTGQLIGRDALFIELSQALAAAGDRGDALVLRGERGIGKTAGLQAARQIARTRGRLVLETVGNEAESDLPFAGLQRLLRPLLRVVQTLPEVQRRALLAALGLHDEPHGDDLIVSVATVAVLAEAARDHGLLITADDVQWLDRQTQHILGFLARRLDGSRISVIAALSGQEAVRAIDAGFRAVHLDRLDESDAHRLVARRAPDLDRGQRVWVVAEAAGNPLALLELAKSVTAVDVAHLDPVSPGWSLTPPLERAFAGGVRDLPSAAGNAVLVAAVALDARLPEIIAAASLMYGSDVGTSVIDLPRGLGLLTVDETRVHFAHPLVKAAIVQNESVSRRQAAHRALGAVITVSAHRRAWHRAAGAAGHDDAVAAELEATTADSIRRGDTPAAIAALERAAQLSTAPRERGRRLILAARHAARLGRADTVLRLLASAVSGDLSDFDRVRADLLRSDCDGAVIADSSRVLQLCSAARRAAAAGETALALELADAAARRRCAAPVDAGALAQLRSLAASLARNSPDDARAVAVLALADPIANGPAARAALPDSRAMTELDGDDLAAFGVAARALGDYSAALTFFDRAEVALRARGLLGPLGRNLCVAADLRVDLGQWDRAAAALHGFAALSTESMSASHRASALATTAKLAALRGDTASALDLVSQLEHSPAARSGSRFLARSQTVRGIACLAAGRHLDAYLALRRVFDPGEPSYHFREQFDAVAYLAEAAAHAGRQDDARADLEAVRRLATASGAPILLTHLAYADAVLATAGAEELFLVALASDGSGSPWQRARLQLGYGRWLRRQQRVTESRVPLQASLTVLRRLGATRWAGEASDELQASGLSAESPSPSTDPLSNQELRIARLAAQGLSNREIGDQMCLSPRTVSSHLYRMFPKLGISTRGQIAERLT